MTEINNLFIELLEVIFQKLPLYTRLTCKEVCQHWYEILMTSVKFRNDRHIYLRNCIIQQNREPWNVFVNAKYPYEYLTICKNNEELNMCPYPVASHSEDFWMHLGNSVTKVTFQSGVSDRMFEIIPFMPSVKTIILGDYMLYCWFRSFLARKERHKKVPKEKRTRLKNIETVCIELVEFVDHRDFFDKYEMLITHVPFYVTLNFQKISCMSTREMLILLLFLKNRDRGDLASEHSVDETYWSAGSLSGITFKKVDGTKRLPFDCLGLTIESFDELKPVFRQHPHLKELHLDLVAHQELNIPFQVSILTELTIYGNIDKQSFKAFEILKNLKSLELQTTHYYTEDGQIFHFFGHDVVNLPKLEKLKLDVPFNCESCMEALSKSFPTLMTFQNNKKEMVSLNTIGFRLKNWQYLEYFSVSTASMKSFECISNNVKEPNLNLRSLTIVTEAKLTKHKPQDFTKLSTVFPYLHTLCFDFHQYLTELPGILKEILVNFPHLATLQINGSTKGSASRAIPSTVIKILTQYGQKIRVLELPGKKFGLMEFEEKTRQCMKNLCLNETPKELSEQEFQEKVQECIQNLRLDLDEEDSDEEDSDEDSDDDYFY